MCLSQRRRSSSPAEKGRTCRWSSSAPAPTSARMSLVSMSLEKLSETFGNLWVSVYYVLPLGWVVAEIVELPAEFLRAGSTPYRRTGFTFDVLPRALSNGNYIRECRNHRFSAAALKGTTCSSSECLDLARHFPLFTGFARTAIRPAYIGHRDVAFSLRGPAQPAAFGSSRTRLPRGPLAAGPCPSLPPGRSGCAPARRQHFPRQCATDQAPRQPLHLRFRVCVAHVVPPAKFPQVAP